jgi:hypothetical protein
MTAYTKPKVPSDPLAPGNTVYWDQSTGSQVPGAGGPAVASRVWYDNTLSQLQTDNVQDAIDLIDNQVDNITGASSSLDARVDTLETEMDTAQADIVALQGRVSTAESNITTLQGDTAVLDTRLDTAEANITTLQGRTGQATETAVGVAELATTAEVTTGTDDLRIITPLKLAQRLAGFTVVPASETVAGIAEIATTAETNTGTDDSRIITPAKLSAYVASHAPAPPSATESIAGIAEIATQAEANAGTDDLRFITALKLNNRLASPVVSAFSAHKSASQIIATNALTAITNWIEIKDQGNDFNPTTGVFTCRYTGQYRFSLTLTHDISATAAEDWFIGLQTSNRNYTTQYAIPTPIKYNSQSYSWLVDMEAGDTANVFVARVAATGGQFSIFTNSDFNHFSCELVGGISGIMGSGGFASQAEANAGTVADKALSPATLRNFTGTIAGPVGIGIAPAAKLHVYDAAGHNAVLVETAAANYQARLDLKNPSRIFSVFNDNQFWIYDITANAARLTINSDGRVGIGIVPTHWLHVYATTSCQPRFESNDASDTGLWLKNSVRNWIIMTTAGAELMIYDATVGAVRFKIDTAGKLWCIGGAGNIGAI